MLYKERNIRIGFLFTFYFSQEQDNCTDKYPSSIYRVSNEWAFLQQLQTKIQIDRYNISFISLLLFKTPATQDPTRFLHMQSASNNIFSSAGQQSTSMVQAISNQVKDFSQSMLKRLQQIAVSLSLSEQTSKKISENLNKAQQFLKQNKEVVLGVTMIATLYFVRERRAEKIRNSKSRHIHSLTSNPNSPLKRSGSHNKQQPHCDNILDSSKQPHPTKPRTRKPTNLKPFISEGQEQEEEYIRSDQEDKDNPDLSTSTRRTESMVSDIEPLKKKKKKNLEPIMDLVQEEDQTQDRVFFEMFRTYRES